MLYLHCTLHFSAQFIESLRGAKLLVIDGNTFNKHVRNKMGGFRYKCSSSKKGCKAFAHVSRGDTIVKCNILHNHAPVQFWQTANGLYYVKK